MHMADALVSPAVGGTMWAASAGLLAYAAHRVKQATDDRLVPLMGVLGAFVFTAQMINFAIPGTGSSGHLGGGLLLAVLLGPAAAFLVIASVLTVQALFFADGGLLALGCNIFNLGFLPAFLAYPLLYRPLAGAARHTSRAWLAAVVAGVVGLQLGALGVVLETTLSGRVDLPLRTFLLLLLPIHLAIGVVEGLATAAVVAFVARAQPATVLPPAGRARRGGPAGIGLVVAALLLGAVVSWFASARPDGLEWALGKVTGQAELAGGPDTVHTRLAAVQERTAILPDYDFHAAGTATPAAAPARASPGTSVAGVVGGLLTLVLVVLVGLALRTRRATA